MKLNRAVAGVMEPPIGAAYAWIEDKVFPKDKPLIDVSQAVPGYPPADSLNRHLADLILSDPSLARYGQVEGAKELRQALSDDIEALYGGGPDQDRILITAGCNQAFCLAASAIAGPGDEIIIPLPYYFDHDMWLRAQGINPTYVPFDAANPGLLDPAEIASLITPNTRALLLVTPNNPTGIVYSPEIIASFHELCKKRDIYLILDETYRDFIDQRPHELFTRPEWDRHLIHLYSFSKVFAITGYRTGAVAAHRTIIEQIIKLMDCVAVCAPRLGQAAALFGLQHLAPWRQEKAAIMRDRLNALTQAFTRNDWRFELVSCGAYFAYVKHHFAGKSSHDIAKILVEKEHILALPGTMFGPGQEQYLRIAFANVEASLMPEMARRMANFSI